MLGRVGDLPKEMGAAGVRALCQKSVCVRRSLLDGGRPIRRVAVGGGACGK